MRRFFLVGLLLIFTVPGCTDMVRTTANLYGYKGDIYASDCLPESLHAGHCVSSTMKSKP